MLVHLKFQARLLDYYTPPMSAPKDPDVDEPRWLTDDQLATPFTMAGKPSVDHSMMLLSTPSSDGLPVSSSPTVQPRTVLSAADQASSWSNSTAAASCW